MTFFYLHSTLKLNKTLDSPTTLDAKQEYCPLSFFEMLVMYKSSPSVFILLRGKSFSLPLLDIFRQIKLFTFGFAFKEMFTVAFSPSRKRIKF